MYHLQVKVFCVVTPCSVATGYRRFRGPCFLHLQHWPPKLRCPTTTLHGVTSQKILT